MTKLPLFAALGAVLTIAAAQPAAAASGKNLLKNPGFETGDFTGWTVTGGYNNVAGDSVCPAGAHGGKYCYYSKDGDGAISQTVTSAAGTYLHISAYANVTAPDFTALYTDLPAVAILVNGTVVFYTTRQGNKQVIGADVVSTGNDEITFMHYGNTATLLDNVSVISNTTP